MNPAILPIDDRISSYVISIINPNLLFLFKVGLGFEPAQNLTEPSGQVIPVLVWGLPHLFGDSLCSVTVLSKRLLTELNFRTLY